VAGGWGGSRVGAGRKPKDKATARLHGTRRRSVVRFPSAVPSAPAPPAAPVEPPVGLSAKVSVPWRELAPHALAAGTLTLATRPAFVLLLRNILLERRLSRGRSAGGADHRGMISRVEIGMTRFGLAPVGKPMVQPAKPEDAFAEFDVVGSAS
jgi:hypothetical protein